jgi:hypothetical protein
VTAIYDRYRYDNEKRAALETWAEVLTDNVHVKPAPTAARHGPSLARTPTSSSRRYPDVHRLPCGDALMAELR